MSNLEYLYRASIAENRSLVLKTFHPDNAVSVTHFDDDYYPVIDTDQVDSAFSDDMEIQEAIYYHKISGKLKNERSHLMVDYERKYTDNRIMASMIEAFLDQQMTIKLMPRSCDIAELSQGSPYRFREILLGIAAANNILNCTSHIPPIRDLIIPQVNNQRVLKSARATIKALRKAFPDSHKDLSGIKLVPLIENTNSMMHIRDNVLVHMNAIHGDSFEEYVRIMLAMSDTSMESGILATMTCLRYALAEIYHFAVEKNITILPILGGGTLPFRGLQSPENICNLLTHLPATQVTIQSAMTFDYAEEGIHQLYEGIMHAQQNHIQNISHLAKHVTQEDRTNYQAIRNMAEKSYWQDLLIHTQNGLSLPMLLASKGLEAPIRRNRVGVSTGGAGRDKVIANQTIRFQRAIAHVFGLLSIGLGSGSLYGANYLSTMQNKYARQLETLLPILRTIYQQDLQLVSEKVAKKAEKVLGINHLISFINERKAVIKAVFDIDPQTNEKHEKHLFDALQYWQKGDIKSCRLHLQKAAIERKSIG